MELVATILACFLGGIMAIYIIGLVIFLVVSSRKNTNVENVEVHLSKHKWFDIKYK